MVRETLGSFQPSTNLTENIIRTLKETGDTDRSRCTFREQTAGAVGNCGFNPYFGYTDARTRYATPCTLSATLQP